MSKRYKRHFSILLIVAMLCTMVGCQSGDQGQPRELPQPTQLDYARFQTTKEEVEAQHAEFGKVEFNPSDEAEFSIACVIIMVYPFANEVEYTKEDFAEVGCTRITFITENLKHDKRPSRTLGIFFDADSKQDIYDAIEILLQRDDVYCAEPNCLIGID